MGLRIESEGERAVLIADAAVNPMLLDEPDRAYVSDGDRGGLRGDAPRLLPELVDQDVLVVCGHYPAGGIGHVVTRGRVVWEAAGRRLVFQTQARRGPTRMTSRSQPERRLVFQKHKVWTAVSWPRDDAKLDRVRALMAEHELDALVVRAPDNVLYLTNFWGMKGYDAVVFPRRASRC